IQARLLAAVVADDELADAQRQQQHDDDAAANQTVTSNSLLANLALAFGQTFGLAPLILVAPRFASLVTLGDHSTRATHEDYYLSCRPQSPSRSGGRAPSRWYPARATHCALSESIGRRRKQCQRA